MHRYRYSAVGLIVLGMVSVQFGAAFAITLFDELGGAGTVFLRVLFAAVILLAVFRPRLKGRTREDVGLAVGFGVAQGTGVRALGGAVFALGGVGAAWLWVQRRGWAVALGLGALYVGAFVLAHVLALGVGMASWLAVALVTLVSAGVTYAVADRA